MHYERLSNLIISAYLCSSYFQENSSEVFPTRQDSGLQSVAKLSLGNEMRLFERCINFDITIAFGAPSVDSSALESKITDYNYYS